MRTETARRSSTLLSGVKAPLRGAGRTPPKVCLRRIIVSFHVTLLVSGLRPKRDRSLSPSIIIHIQLLLALRLNELLARRDD
jgi:hypothetical protein